MLIGGTSAPAVERSSRIGDGWMALAILEEFEEEPLGSALERIDASRAVGSPFRKVVRVVGEVDAGNAEHRARLHGLVSLGFDEIIVEVGLSDLDAAQHSIARLREFLGA